MTIFENLQKIEDIVTRFGINHHLIKNHFHLLSILNEIEKNTKFCTDEEMNLIIQYLEDCGFYYMLDDNNKIDLEKLKIVLDYEKTEELKKELQDLKDELLYKNRDYFGESIIPNLDENMKNFTPVVLNCVGGASGGSCWDGNIAEEFSCNESELFQLPEILKKYNKTIEDLISYICKSKTKITGGLCQTEYYGNYTNYEYVLLKDEELMNFLLS